MKIRNGFVSNSSSSSFIMGIARITDVDKLHKYISDNNIKVEYDISILSRYDMEKKTPYRININNGKAIMESFTYNEISLDMNEMGHLDMMVVYDHSGGDDNDFWNGDEYDYDIDSDFFGENENKIMSMFSAENSGLDIKTSDVCFGAGRDG